MPGVRARLHDADERERTNVNESRVCMTVSVLCQESSVAGKMKEAFLGEKGLTGSVRSAPLEKVFDIANVKKVREAHGRPCAWGGERISDR